MADHSAVVVVLPSDSVQAIADKVRAAGAAQVQLLVPEAAPALQSREGFAQLQQALGKQVELEIFSPDERVINAARLGQFNTVPIHTGAANRGPATTSVADDNPYATRTFDPVAMPTDLFAPEDAAFLDALDQVPAQEGYGFPRDSDASFAELDDDTYTVPPVRNQQYQQQDWAADDQYDDDEHDRTDHDVYDEDEIDGAEDEYAARPAYVSSWDEEYDSPRRSTSNVTRNAPLAAPPRLDRRRGRVEEYDDEDEYPQQRRVPVGAILFLALLLVIGGAAAWYYFNRVTIVVTAPPSEVQTTPFTGETIPLVSSATQNQGAVVAQAVTASVNYTTQVQASPVLTDTAYARGTVTIVSALPQPFDLPQGTRFIATNEAGEQIPFLTVSPVTIPPLTTGAPQFDGQQFVTNATPGRIDVEISAASAGTRGNVAANTINRFILPSGEEIAGGDLAGGARFAINNGAPTEGGAQEQRYLVTRELVEQQLPNALNELYQQATEQLGAQAPSGTQIDQVTIHPRKDEFGDANALQPPVIDPPVGQELQNSQTFSITVQADFSALAVPANQPLATQLQEMVRPYFTGRGNLPCSQQELTFTVNGATWDGERLTIDGEMICTPAGALSTDTLSKVRSAVIGQSRDAAETSLQQLQRQGLIGAYQLSPGNRSLPPFGFMIDVKPGSTITDQDLTPDRTIPPATAPLSATDTLSPTNGAEQ